MNISTFVGMRTAGIPGALCATFGVVLPSFLIIILVAKFYEKFRKSSIVQGCMTGLKPAVVGLIAAALVTTGQAVFFPSGISAGVFTTPAFLCSAGIFTAMLALSLKNLHPHRGDTDFRRAGSAHRVVLRAVIPPLEGGKISS